MGCTSGEVYMISYFFRVRPHKLGYEMEVTPYRWLEARRAMNRSCEVHLALLLVVFHHRHDGWLWSGTQV